MPRVSLPEHSRANAMRSRWFGSMFAWILNTKADMRFSSASTVRLSAFCARGGGAIRPMASSRSPTPKFFSAEPKNTGDKLALAECSQSNGLQASRTSSSSPETAPASRLAFSAATSAMLISRKVPALPASPSSSRTPPPSISTVPTKSRPRPTGQFTGVVSSASVFSISSSRSNGSRLSRSILLMKVTIGMSRRRHTSNSFRCAPRCPWRRRSP